MDTSATDHLLTTTRAVRRRLDLDRPVPRALIEDCLRIAIQAPTGGNSQQWRWLVITDEDTRFQLAEMYRTRSDILKTAGERAAASGDAQTARVYESALAFADVLHKVPVMLVPCIRGRVEQASNAEVAGLYGSILPAVWSFMLAARSRGLGTVWTSLHLVKEKEAAALLNIPDDFIQVALIPVAYTIGDDFRPAKRQPAEEVTYWNRWGE